MGTGSGIIGVTLALELKERAKEVVLADISPQALDLALENAMRLGARVSTVQTDLFENIPLEKPVLRQEGADSSASVPEEEEKDAGREMRFGQPALHCGWRGACPGSHERSPYGPVRRPGRLGNH